MVELGNHGVAKGEDDDDFKRAGTLASGEMPGGRCGSGTLGSGPDIDVMGAAHSNPRRV